MLLGESLLVEDFGVKEWNCGAENTEPHLVVIRSSSGFETAATYNNINLLCTC